MPTVQIWCPAHCHTVPCVHGSCVSARLPHMPYHCTLMVCIGWTLPMYYMGASMYWGDESTLGMLDT